MKTNICVYTCITGEYDSINEFFDYKEKNIDYYLFTNNKKIVSDFWNVIYIENNNLDNIRLARKIKILGNEIINKYKISVWIDGATYLKKPISDFINNECDMKKYSLVSFKHPNRNCIYDEAKACVIYNRDSKETIMNEISFLKKENYPCNNGLIESAILVRRNDDVILKKTMKLWFEMILKYSYRDQLSFNYVAWQEKLNFKLLNMSAFDNKYFGRNIHCSQKDHFLKEYRVYFGDDSNLKEYKYEYDFVGNYEKKGDYYFIDLVAPVSGSSLKLRLDSIGGIKVSKILGVDFNHIEFCNSILFDSSHILLENNPTIILNENYKLGDKITIGINMNFLNSVDYIKIIDSLYYKINEINDENKSVIIENKQILKDNLDLQKTINCLQNSLSWKLTKPLRKINGILKRN